MNCGECSRFIAHKKKFLLYDGLCHRDYKHPKPVNSKSCCSFFRVSKVQNQNIRKGEES